MLWSNGVCWCSLLSLKWNLEIHKVIIVINYFIRLSIPRESGQTLTQAFKYSLVYMLKITVAANIDLFVGYFYSSANFYARLGGLTSCPFGEYEKRQSRLRKLMKDILKCSGSLCTLTAELLWKLCLGFFKTFWINKKDHRQNIPYLQIFASQSRLRLYAPCTVKPVNKQQSTLCWTDGTLADSQLQHRDGILYLMQF